MNIQLMSDIHLEHHEDKGAGFIDYLDPTDVDVLVLAGDITSTDNMPFVFEKFKAKYNSIIYVPGNHEYYKSSFEKTDKVLQTLDINVLNPGIVNIGVVKFVGATMWFASTPDTYRMQGDINDFTFIKDSHLIYERNKEHVKFLNENIDNDTVVITHHLPSQHCVSERFAGSKLNAFFVCEMDELIYDKRPKHWLHGHTHDSVDTKVFGTRILCNPFGYPRQLNSRFESRFLIQV